ncbi:DUF3035 domain-containing protein [Mesobacterium sp. TK19101]|uniref:DUF3035 domain-containing protein n=1 Tax=Mesobacterium hydrothermale TaxID=3111907 RepID=A0ABU6HLA6_9RHOB|nr:DUF3035 domain-containing protein [Mesobacterium sp. TK19101]MEC3862872.1 DUF3035 domain-containing protein [Mesobacterium sp. TK19101]
MTGPRIVILLAILGLAACGGRERDITLHDLRSNSRSPEEFSILPAKPLEAPESYAALPAPTPGGANRTDQTPIADAVAALGGKPSRLQAEGYPATDRALVARASRYGLQGTIRQQLAAEDLEFRKRKSLFTWSVVPRDDYYRAYRRETLDPYDALNRYRRAGARTPSAPPN